MPTSKAIDRVAKKTGYEIASRYQLVSISRASRSQLWLTENSPHDEESRLELLRYNLNGRRARLSICGEKSFGTGSNHSREKDGRWGRRWPDSRHEPRKASHLRSPTFCTPTTRSTAATRSIDTTAKKSPPTAQKP
ncbi:hypothetical protein A4X13_0g6166 [Tilletia indica]|uniref:Uncharacterized protein n=1 Tax=Tilletia indica TaxID=43049 RepID=A0A8T8SPC6_9BASI|nr:hypothetical protein A4X13_0g6166 [Tilletia indica]